MLEKEARSKVCPHMNGIPCKGSSCMVWQQLGHSVVYPGRDMYGHNSYGWEANDPPEGQCNYKRSGAK